MKKPILVKIVRISYNPKGIVLQFATPPNPNVWTHMAGTALDHRFREPGRQTAYHFLNKFSLDEVIDLLYSYRTTREFKIEVAKNVIITKSKHVAKKEYKATFFERYIKYPSKSAPVFLNWITHIPILEKQLLVRKVKTKSTI